MASAGNAEPNGPDEIQFDRAEFTTSPAGGVECSACKRPIDRVYYELSGHILCEPCVKRFDTGDLGGSRFLRFLKASGFGFAAALGAAVIIYLVREIFRVNAALISILAGYMVGSAVRQGSGYRGGRVYQVLAVFLTYSALSWSYLPLITKEVFAQFEKARNEAKNDPAAAGKTVVTGEKPANDQAGANKDVKAAPRPNAAEKKPEKPVSPVLIVLLLAGLVVFLIGFTYCAPMINIVSEFPQGLIGLLIVFWGLHQAWQMTHKVALEFHGPFPVGGGGPTRPGVSANA